MWRRSAGISIIVGALVFGGCSSSAPPSIDATRRQLIRGDLTEAGGVIERQLAAQDDSAAWRILAAELELRRGESDRSLSHLKLLPRVPVASTAALLTTLGTAAERRGFAAITETAFRRALAADAESREARTGLAYLLGVEGRCWEAVPLLLESVRRGEFTVHHLVLLGASDPVIEDVVYVRRCLKADPENPLPRLGEIRTAIRRDDASTARGALLRIVATAADCGEAQGRLGQLLVDGDAGAMLAWNSSVPRAADRHPEVWIARGNWARDHNQADAAVRCFWEALRLDSEHRIANQQLGQLLAAKGMTEQAQGFLRRVAVLQELAALVDRIYLAPTDCDSLVRAGELTEQLGRQWEAAGWARIALAVDPQFASARALESRLASLSPASVRVRNDANPTAALNLSNLPLPDFNVARQSAAPAAPETSFGSRVAFSDRSADFEINFVYRSRGPDEVGDLRMYETTGGGVAVLDYDGDGNFDLYFPQGGSPVPSEASADRQDRCYRNLDRERSMDVTSSAGFQDADYGQGASAGDYNNDGFADLYVANLGQNRLYRNNGDGTFADVTESAGLSGASWTTSCAVVDLNQDGWPDLYDVNYLSQQDALRATCRRGEELRWCSPDAFSAESDELFLGTGDGQFIRATSESGIGCDDGKGLGIVVADFDASGRLGIFVANDAVPNFYFENRSQRWGERPTFVECAVERGLAFDADGLPQACMGVAADDWNADGRLDLFVTNFYEQSNTLYQQQSRGLFTDATRASGLRVPSLASLGFGTQSLDVDLDGRQDIVVVNGHVLDLTEQGIPFRMRPQLFRNRGTGRFIEEAADGLGEFFRQEILGRGLARLDWNRDGRADFVVSTIGSPASLIINVSEATGHSATVRLVGVRGARDAIGASVTLRAGGQDWTRQLTAGDGYEARNENALIFGLASAENIESWTVHWPNGNEQTFPGMPGDCEVLAIEDRSVPLILRRSVGE